MGNSKTEVYHRYERMKWRSEVFAEKGYEELARLFRKEAGDHLKRFVQLRRIARARVSPSQG